MKGAGGVGTSEQIFVCFCTVISLAFVHRGWETLHFQDLSYIVCSSFLRSSLFISSRTVHGAGAYGDAHDGVFISVGRELNFAFDSREWRCSGCGRRRRACPVANACTVKRLAFVSSEISLARGLFALLFARYIIPEYSLVSTTLCRNRRRQPNYCLQHQALSSRTERLSICRAIACYIERRRKYRSISGIAAEARFPTPIWPR